MPKSSMSERSCVWLRFCLLRGGSSCTIFIFDTWSWPLGDRQKWISPSSQVVTYNSVEVLFVNGRINVSVLAEEFHHLPEGFHVNITKGREMVRRLVPHKKAHDALP